jgi:hypothetical protein
LPPRAGRYAGGANPARRSDLGSSADARESPGRHSRRWGGVSAASTPPRHGSQRTGRPGGRGIGAVAP